MLTPGQARYVKPRIYMGEIKNNKERNIINEEKSNQPTTIKQYYRKHRSNFI